MKIILIRHGETEWNAQGRLQGREDVPLSEAGRAQARATAQVLQQYLFSGHKPVIVASPLQRAAETARAIANQLGVSDICINNELLERDYGAASGLTAEERQRCYPDDHFPGLEDRASAEERIFLALTRLAQEHSKRDVVVVSHGEILHMFLAQLRGEQTQTGKSALQNAAISSVVWDGQFQIEFYNLSAAELEAQLQQGACPPDEWVLGSASPRRRELLQVVHTPFLLEKTDAEEKAICPGHLSLLEKPAFLAEVKARDIAQRYPDRLVIGSDTGVLLQDAHGWTMLGKPHDEAEAAAMLRMLSGRKHTVCTGVCLCYRGQVRTFSETAQVEFYPLSEQEIAEYVATKESMDKAGAYGVQGQGALLVKGIEGDFYTIMGLPIARLKREIAAWLNQA